ncbi:sensor histidine kinase [Paracoccus sp. p4-l81]|uniref:sensor histidine kinase n=1 Tax=unclassified Paracoccus (in: a-proteobacteria) TaxID=2688777 RepID=UPI0035BA87D0
MDGLLTASLLEALPVPVILTDAEARIMAANAAMRAFLGDDLVGRPFVTVLRQPGINAALEAVLAGQGPRGLRTTIAGPTREMVADVSASRVEGTAGQGALIVLQDTTALEHAEAMRRDFVANVSHELRTPLTALMGFIETLRGPARDDAAARDRFLTIMEREAGRMNRLVADLLSLSRVESEERRRPAARLDLAALIRGCALTLRPQAEAAGVSFASEGLGDPVPVPGDADQLTQLFTNLIENALKYGASGGEIRLRLTRIPREPVLRGPAIQVEVIDKGEGIDPIHLPRLTERFYRVDTHRSREKGGTGLGLAIVKHIINRHRGRLKITSRKGHGSTFTVLLPETASLPGDG